MDYGMIADALRDAIDATVSRTAAGVPRAQHEPMIKPASSVGELAARLGGGVQSKGTASLAKQLGVAQRTVERYISREEGKSSQQRGFGKNKAGESIAEKFSQAANSQAEAENERRKSENKQRDSERRKDMRQARKDAVKQMRSSGAKADYSGQMRYSDTHWPAHPPQQDLSGAVMSQILDSLAEGTYEGDKDAANTFVDGFTADYLEGATIETIDQLTFSF
jgi:predicted transcriptional regulator